jgi:hypothetical protein
MAKKKNYWYVLVMTNEGPKFVTEMDNSQKMCYWDINEAPYEFGSKSYAQETAVCLTINMNYAMAVCTPYEITSQPYYYQRGHFKWVDKEDAE